jgi:predicted ATP-binding protein involved in virulence
MRVTKLFLRDFRGFEKTEVSFPAAGPAVLAGVNGCGKSSVLDALGSLLSCIPSDLAGYHASWFAAGDTTNIRSNAASAHWLFEFAGEVEVRWGLSAWHDPTARPGSNIKKDFHFKPLLEAPLPNSLPLLSHLHASATRTVDDRSGSLPKEWFASSPRLGGYVGAFEAESKHHSALHTWLANAENIENQEKVQRQNLSYSLPTLSAVRRATATFLGGLHAVRMGDLRVIRAEHAVGYITTSLVIQKAGEALLVDQLSDGERRMLVLVADLARRAVVINGHLNDPLLSPGVVLIDEVEMHLHPVWQRRVMGALQATFPKVQFIVSTHSPQVLASVSNDNVIVLKDHHVLPGPHRVSGRDANAILEDHMGTPARPDDVAAQLKQLYTAIDDAPKEAERLLGELIERLGENDPEVTRAHALLDLVKG